MRNDVYMPKLVEAEVFTALEALPEGPLRDRADRVLRELAHFLERPRCSEQQADGVPCASVHSACDSCARVLAVLDRIELELKFPAS